MVDLNELTELLINNIDGVCEHFGIDYVKYPNRIAMPCPIHGGDREEGCSLFITGNSHVGNWSCWTHNCQIEYGKTIFGFIKGLLSRQENKDVDFKTALNWCLRFLNIDGETIEIKEEDRSKRDFVKLVDSLLLKESDNTSTITKEDVRKYLKIPAPYYLSRGYSHDIIDKFDVGYYGWKGRKMFDRTVVPVYDQTGNIMIGCVGRTQKPECSKCGWHHYENYSCPKNHIEKIWGSKWINSVGFKKGHYLYNIWNASKYIYNTNTVILVEGQGDVWRLEESGIYNSLGMFGCHLSDEQLVLLEKSGAMNILLLTDNDRAGLLAREKIGARLGRLFNVSFFDLPKKDVGEMSVEEVRDLILPVVQKI